jgi:hypothetical protein
MEIVIIFTFHTLTAWKMVGRKSFSRLNLKNSYFFFSDLTCTCTSYPSLVAPYGLVVKLFHCSVRFRMRGFCLRQLLNPFLQLNLLLWLG